MKYNVPLTMYVIWLLFTCQYHLLKTFANSLDPDKSDKIFDLIWILTDWHSDMVFIKEYFKRIDFRRSILILIGFCQHVHYEMEMVCDTPQTQMYPRIHSVGILPQKYKIYAPEIKVIMTRNSMWDPWHHDVSTNQIWNSYLNKFRIYALDMIILKLKKGVKVTVTQIQYATLWHSKVYIRT